MMQDTASAAPTASPIRHPERSASSPNPGAEHDHDEGGDAGFVGRTRSRTRSRSRSHSKNKSNVAGKPLVLVESTQGDAVIFSVPAKSPSALHHHPLPRPTWQADADAHTCYTCDKPFTLRRRKHHCRACGKVVCGKCSPKEEMRPLPEFGYTDNVRVCLSCVSGYAEREHLRARNVEKMRALITRLESELKNSSEALQVNKELERKNFHINVQYSKLLEDHEEAKRELEKLRRRSTAEDGVGRRSVSSSSPAITPSPSSLPSPARSACSSPAGSTGSVGEEDEGEDVDEERGGRVVSSLTPSLQEEQVASNSPPKTSTKALLQQEELRSQLRVQRVKSMFKRQSMLEKYRSLRDHNNALQDELVRLKSEQARKDAGESEEMEVLRRELDSTRREKLMLLAALRGDGGSGGGGELETVATSVSSSSRPTTATATTTPSSNLRAQMEEKKRLMAQKIRKHQQMMAASMQAQAQEREEERRRNVDAASTTRTKKNDRKNAKAALGTARKVRVPVTLENFPLRTDGGLEEPLLGGEQFRPKASKEEDGSLLCEGCIVS